jgi:hypothetical protein
MYETDFKRWVNDTVKGDHYFIMYDNKTNEDSRFYKVKAKLYDKIELDKIKPKKKTKKKVQVKTQ